MYSYERKLVKKLNDKSAPMINENTSKRNNTQDGVTDIASCPICSGTSSSHIIAQNSAFGKTFDIALCNFCELYYFAKQPSQSFLEDFYEKQYFSEVRKRRFAYLLKSRFSKMRAFSQFAYIQNHLDTSEDKSILEVGSADGSFLSFFKKHGWVFKGLEFNEYIIKRARKQYGIILESKNILDIDPGSERYDIIAMSHVLEHLTDPVEVLGHCKKLLNPGGFIFIELPYSPLPGETTPELLSDYLDTTHLFNFRPSSLQRLLQKSGLELFSPSPDRFFYAVPPVFTKDSKFIGSTLMKGRLPSLNPVKIIPVLATVLQMNICFLSRNDPMKKIPLDAQWEGLGDNLRIIAG